MTRLSVRLALAGSAIALLFFSPAQEVDAWGDEGHQIVAVIAYQLLTPSVKKKVDALLASDQDKLTGNQLSANGEPVQAPEKLCASKQTYDLIKRDLFRRAARPWED